MTQAEGEIYYERLDLHFNFNQSIHQSINVSNICPKFNIQ